MHRATDAVREPIDVDIRRRLIVPGDAAATLLYAKEHWIAAARAAIEERGGFFVALSGGSTPKALFQLLTEQDLDWSRVWLFWGDERAVKPDAQESNYRMAMDAAFTRLGVPARQIFRMHAEGVIEETSVDYENLLKNHLPGGRFDLVMLGMGDDGHTASLFPETHALRCDDRLVIENFVPKLNSWRMTLTFAGIHQARSIALYVIGLGKAKMMKQILEEKHQPDKLPVQRVGTSQLPALWILDKEAASALSICSEK